MTTKKTGRGGLGWVAGGLLVLLVAGGGWLGWLLVEGPPGNYGEIAAGNGRDLLAEVGKVDDWAVPPKKEVLGSIWRDKHNLLMTMDMWSTGLEEQATLFYASVGGELVLLVAFLLVWARRASPRAFLVGVVLVMVAWGVGMAAGLGTSGGALEEVNQEMERVAQELPGPHEGNAGRVLALLAPKLRLTLEYMPKMHRKLLEAQGRPPRYALAAGEGVLVLLLLWGVFRARRAAKTPAAARAT